MTQRAKLTCAVYESLYGYPPFVSSSRHITRQKMSASPISLSSALADKQSELEDDSQVSSETPPIAPMSRPHD